MNAITGVAGVGGVASHESTTTSLQGTGGAGPLGSSGSKLCTTRVHYQRKKNFGNVAHDATYMSLALGDTNYVATFSKRAPLPATDADAFPGFVYVNLTHSHTLRHVNLTI